jgi:hypothetical protein
VLSFVSRHRAGVRATTPVEQVRGGARKSGSSAVVLRQGGDLAQVETFYSPQKGPGNCTRPLPSASMAETGRAAVLSVFYELGGPAAQTAAGSDCGRGHGGVVGVL